MALTNEELNAKITEAVLLLEKWVELFPQDITYKTGFQEVTDNEEEKDNLAEVFITKAVAISKESLTYIRSLES